MASLSVPLPGTETNKGEKQPVKAWTTPYYLWYSVAGQEGGQRWKSMAFRQREGRWRMTVDLGAPKLG